MKAPGANVVDRHPSRVHNGRGADIARAVGVKSRSDVGWEGLGFVVVDALVEAVVEDPEEAIARCRAAASSSENCSIARWCVSRRRFLNPLTLLTHGKVGGPWQSG
jgi:hypothetical protein